MQNFLLSLVELKVCWNNDYKKECWGHWKGDEVFKNTKNTLNLVIWSHSYCFRSTKTWQTFVDCRRNHHMRSNAMGANDFLSFEWNELLQLIELLVFQITHQLSKGKWNNCLHPTFSSPSLSFSFHSRFFLFSSFFHFLYLPPILFPPSIPSTFCSLNSFALTNNTNTFDLTNEYLSSMAENTKHHVHIVSREKEKQKKERE